MNTTGRALLRDALRQAERAIDLAGQADAQDVDQLVDRAGRARAAEDDRVVLVGAHALADDLARVLAVTRRLPAGARRLGVRVAVERHHLAADEVLDEPERPPRGGVVGVGDAQRAVGRGERLVGADDRRADVLQQPSLVGVARLHLVAERQRRQRHRRDRQAALVRQRAAGRAQERVERLIAEGARGPAALEGRQLGADRAELRPQRAQQRLAQDAAGLTAEPIERVARQRVGPGIGGRDAGSVARGAEQERAGADQRAREQGRQAQAGGPRHAPEHLQPPLDQHVKSIPGVTFDEQRVPLRHALGHHRRLDGRDRVVGRAAQDRQQAQGRTRVGGDRRADGGVRARRTYGLTRGRGQRDLTGRARQPRERGFDAAR